MQISQLMTRHVRITDPGASLETAARIMGYYDVGALPVAEDNQLVGMITDRDLVVRAMSAGVDAQSLTVREVMTDTVTCCYEDDSVAEVVKAMAKLRLRRLPVLDRQECLVGIVSLGDIAHAAGSELTATTLRAVSRQPANGAQPSAGLAGAHAPPRSAAAS